MRIGLLQITGHPAITVGDVDLLREPAANDQRLRLSPIAANLPELRDCLKETKRVYTEWLQSRVNDILLNLEQAAGGPPDILVFPECSLPLAILPRIRQYSEKTKSTVFAGTHSRPFSAEGDKAYTDLGVERRNLSGLPTSSPGLLPIVSSSGVLLRPKYTPSPFEFSEVAEPEMALPVLPTVTLQSGQTIGSLICAEALRRPRFDCDPSLVVIVSYERDPSRFQPHIETLVANRCPVVFVNDAQFGGSGVSLVVDERAVGRWWFDSPMHGRLPTGEAYVEIEILAAGAVEVGVVAPRQQALLRRFVSIYGSDDPIAAIEKRAATAALARDTAVVRVCCDELESHTDASMATRIRWRRIQSLLEAEALTAEWSAVLLPSVVTEHASTLRTTQGRLADGAATSVKRVLDTAAARSGDPALVGRLYMLSNELRARAGGIEPASVTSPSSPPLDRTEPIRDVRQALAAETRAIVVITGMPGIGKSTVISTALVQAHVRALEIECHPGTSADFLYEQLLRSSGFVPTGQAPRSEFDPNEMAHVLRGVRAIWFSKAHNLFEYGRWNTSALKRLFDALLEAYKQGGRATLIFEALRDVPLDLPLGLQAPIRRRIRGLPEQDAVDFLGQQLRRADVPDETISLEQRRGVVQLVDCHPSLLMMAADAIGRVGAAEVIRDLKRRGKFYRALLEALFKSLNPSEAERRCLAGLTRCRQPIPEKHLEYLVPADRLGPALADLSGACLLERLPDGFVQATGFLREAIVDGISRADEVRFHDVLTRHFSRVARESGGLSYLKASVEANYHAALAGKRAPFESHGIRDGIVAAARKKYERDDFLEVAALLEPLYQAQGARLPEDVLALLADSFAWSGRFDEAFAIGGDLVKRDTSYLWILVDAGDAALAARRYADARTALQRAEAVRGGDPRVLLLRGRLEERTSDRSKALEYYRDAAAAAKNDAWPFFYLVRCLRRLGRPEEAVAAVEQARAFVDESPQRRLGERLESALLSEEMLCRTIVGDNDGAMSLVARVKDGEDSSPEAIVTAAYAEAAMQEPFSEQAALRVFEAAILRLDEVESTKRHTKAAIRLFRGRLWERIGNLDKAEEELTAAVELGPMDALAKATLAQVLIARAAKLIRFGETAAADAVARKALSVTEALLRLNPSSKEGLQARDRLFVDFGLR